MAVQDDRAIAAIDRSVGDGPGAGDVAGPVPTSEAGFSGLFRSAVRMLIMYAAVSYLSLRFRNFMSPPSASPPAAGSAAGPHTNQWPLDTPFRLDIQLSDQYNRISTTKGDRDADQQIVYRWSSPDLLHYNWDSSVKLPLVIPANITLPESISTNNATCWAHITLRPVPSSLGVIKLRHPINVFLPKRKPSNKINLISGIGSDDGYVGPAEGDTTWQSYWRPMLSIRLIIDQTVFPQKQIPSQIKSSYKIDGQTQAYLPPVYIDYFWMLADRMIMLNNTVKEAPLTIEYNPISFMKWQLQSQMDQSFKQQQSFGSTEDDTEGIRRMLLETNPYLLLLTFAVSMLHMIFDILAFKNDIAFWKADGKSMEGLSVRSIVLNAGCQFIIFLYLLDNDTSWMILASSFMGVLIEIWKVTRACDIKITWPSPENGLKFPEIKFNDKPSYLQSETDKHDKQAIKYLSYIFYPLSVGYALYSLYYNEHKSTYSWILSSATSFVYMFGFILMCPQLYLNYKLKSVAHLPWRMLTYKALNTFIDDLFAFIITMPIMHRLACFRDDIVFFIYLYQRWIYRVDYTRVNEFGLRPDDAAAIPEQIESDAASDALTLAGPDDSGASLTKRRTRAATEDTLPEQASQLAQTRTDLKKNK